MKLTEVLDIDDLMVSQMKKLVARGPGMLRVMSSAGIVKQVYELEEDEGSDGVKILVITTEPPPNNHGSQFVMKRSGIARERTLKRQPDGTYLLIRRSMNEEIDHERPLFGLNPRQGTQSALQE
jgi:hypothetical protein